ncbi:TonB-dependent receptor [Croceicoccus ponticola]|uniref:TonB-dependent receptor n=1 Tax=Croceicoccus ponticola TaxID=2217664 RepID=A0A437GU51_9SPHN|nr:TonB-dependent receptor [Croceicoccus ponticola]RVQ64847.1 TonB-dependent receptor [Croceicoccus ponticola]
MIIHNRFAASRAVLAASISMLAFATPALAQTDPTETQVAEPERTGGLTEIIVTARKRAESAQNIPVAVTAFAPEQIQRYDISSVERIAASTPSLQVGKATTGSGAQITLRGIGTPASALGIESSTAVIVDGVYYGNGRILNEGFFDLARIEVLKGPQALFFGKNATAGVISIATADPTDQFEGSTRVGYEIKGQRAFIEQILSGPISETLSGRIALRGAKMWGGYTTNYAPDLPLTFTDLDTGTTFNTVAPAGPREAPGERELLGRASLKWEPNSDFTSITKASMGWNRANDPGWNNVIFSCANGFSTLMPDVPCERKWYSYHNAAPAEVGEVFPYAYEGGALGATYKSFQVTNNSNYDLGGVMLTAVLNYQNQRNRWFSDSDYQQRITQIFVGSYEKWKALSGEFRAQTQYDGPLNAMVGVLYQDSKLTADQNVFFGNVQKSNEDPVNQFMAFSKYSTTDGETISPFAQVVWNVVPEVELSGGVRYTHETKDSYFIHPFIRPGIAYQELNPIETKQTFTDWTPEVTIAYKPSRNLNIYAGYKAGYKSGGFSNESTYTNASLPEDLDFEPEKAKGFEGGIKATVADNQLRLDLALYNYKYTDLQVDFFEAQTFRFVTGNAGSARTKGAEFSFEFAPHALPDLSVRGSANYNDAHYIEFAAPCVTGQTPAQGCNLTFNAFDGSLGQDLAGVRMAMAPKWTGSLGVAYDIPVSDGLSLGVSTDARYSSSYNASPFANPIATQGEYVNLDASMFLKSDAGWELGVIGKNLTNQFVVSGALDAPSTGSGTGTAAGRLADQRGYANTPRTVQVQVTYRY